MATTSADRDRRRPSRLDVKGAALPTNRAEKENPRTVTYARRSKQTEKSTSLSRQKAEMERRIREFGGTHDPDGDHYADDDISGSRLAFRPGFEALLGRIAEAGDVDVVLVWELARATRHVLELEALITFLREHGVELRTVQEPMVSLYGPFGDFITRLIGVFAQQETDRLSERLTSSHEQRALHGIFRTNRPPYGMRKVMRPSPFPDRSGDVAFLEPDDDPIPALVGKMDAPPSPASLIREAKDLVLSGWSSNSIARAWNARKIPGPEGGRWWGSTILSVLKNPTIAGYSVRHGQVVQDANGEPVRKHFGVLRVDEWLAVRDALKARKRGGTGRVRRRDEHLLTGLLRCACCGASMARHAASRASYTCMTSGDAPETCPGNAIVEHGVEEIVVEAIMAVFADPERQKTALAALGGEIETPRDEDELRQRRADLQMRLARLEEDRQEGIYDAPEARRRYRERHQEYTDGLADLSRTSRKPPPSWAQQLCVSSVRDAWDALSAEEKRSVVVELVDKIVISRRTSSLHRPGQRGAVFDPSRVEIHWRVQM